MIIFNIEEVEIFKLPHMFFPSPTPSLSVCFSLHFFLQLCYRSTVHVKQNNFILTECSAEQRGLLVDLCAPLFCEILKCRVIEGLDAICLNSFIQ